MEVINILIVVMNGGFLIIYIFFFIIFRAISATKMPRKKRKPVFQPVDSSQTPAQLPAPSPHQKSPAAECVQPVADAGTPYVLAWFYGMPNYVWPVEVMGENGVYCRGDDSM